MNGITYNIPDIQLSDRLCTLRATLKRVNLYEPELHWQIDLVPTDLQQHILSFTPIGTSLCLYDVSFEILAYSTPLFEFYNAGDEITIYFIGYFW